MSVNVYDFDNTLYNGESTLDFYFYCVKHHPPLIRFACIVLVSLVKYKLCRMSEQELMKKCEKYVEKFLCGCPDVKELAEKFWQKNVSKLKPFYNDIKREDDVIISASFEFMLKPAMKIMGVKNLVCSKVNLETKTVSVEYADVEKAKEEIEDLGFEI